MSRLPEASPSNRPTASAVADDYQWPFLASMWLMDSCSISSMPVCNPMIRQERPALVRRRIGNPHNRASADCLHVCNHAQARQVPWRCRSCMVVATFEQSTWLARACCPSGLPPGPHLCQASPGQPRCCPQEGCMRCSPGPVALSGAAWQAEAVSRCHPPADPPGVAAPLCCIWQGFLRGLPVGISLTGGR